MARDVFYVELAKAKTQSKRNIVISECSKGGFTIAQQLEVEEGNKTTNVFLKGAFHVDDIDGLYNIRDALNAAIAEHEKSVEEFGEEKSADDQEESKDDSEEWD